MREDIAALQEQLLHAVGQAVVTTDADGRVTFWNRAAERMYGWTAEEALGRGTAELMIPPEEAAEASALREAVLADGTGSGEFTVRRRDGSTFPIEGSFGAAYDQDGKVAAMIAVTSDISDRQAATERLKRLAAVLDAMADGMLVVELPEGQVTHVNDAACRMLQQDRPAVLGRTVTEVIDDEQLAISQLLRQLTVGRRWDGRILVRVAGQPLQHWDVSAAPVTDIEMTPGVGAIGARDVTAQVQAEEEVRTSEARFRALVQRSVDAALIADEFGVLTYASPALREVFGYDPWEIEGSFGLDYVHPDDRATAERLLTSALAAPGPQPLIELRLRTASGNYVWTEESISNQLHNPDVRGLVINLRDISSRKVAELDLAASEQRFRSIVEGAEEGIWLLDENDQTTFVNPRLEQMLAVAGGGIDGRSPLEFVDPADRAMLAEAIAAQRSGQPQRIECRFRTAGGDVLYMLISGHPILDASGVYRGTQGMFTDISDLKAAQEQLQTFAVRDELTGLANRTLVSEQLAAMLEAQHRVPSLAAVLLLDVNRGLADVVDSLGHEAGDAMLVEAAERITSAVRPTDIVGRSSYDTFVVVCPNLHEASEAEQTARRIAAAIGEPMTLAGRPSVVLPEIGIAYTPAESAADLLRDASSAVHRAAELGGGHVAIYSADLEKRRRAETALGSDLRIALDYGGQLVLHFQPVVALPQENAVGVEALVRWQHPEHGLLSPDAFIPIAERSNLVSRLDRWVLSEATATLSRWRRSGLVDDPFYVAVNVSGSHYADVTLVDEVRSALEAADLPAQNLVLEVTETAVVTNTDAAIAILAELTKLGVGLAIDDFGTGYSSLAYLRRFPVNMLKIDRSFIAGLGENNDDTAIVASTLSLARAVGLSCIAEGVETPQQLNALLELGCTLAQGYLWSPPVPAHALADALAFAPKRQLALAIPNRTPRLSDPPTGDPQLKKQILQLHQAGASVQTIAAALNRKGYRTSHGKRWHATTVARVIADALRAPPSVGIPEGRHPVSIDSVLTRPGDGGSSTGMP